MEKIKTFFVAFLVLFTFCVKAKSQVMTYNDVSYYEGVGSINFENTLWIPICRACYYTIQTEHIFAIELYYKKLELSDKTLLLKFDDGSVIKLHQCANAISTYYDYLSKSYIDLTRMFYKLDDEAIDKLKSQNLIKVRIELSNSDYKDIDLVKKGNKIKKWFNDCYIQADKVIKKRESTKFNGLESDF
jgi:hypothetical protein